MGPREVVPQSPNHPILLCQPMGSPDWKEFLIPSGVWWAGGREPSHQTDSCDSAAWSRNVQTQDGVLSGTLLLHLEPGARVEVSLPILPATCWPLVWPPASFYSSLLSLCLWNQMGSVGLGCPPQKPTMVPAIGACSRPYLLASWKHCQQGLFIPGMVQLPFLPCLQMLTLSKLNLWSLLLFFSLLGSLSGSILEQ